MEESKDLVTVYKIFRTLIYVSLIVEFFMYAIDPQMLDFWGGIVCDIHSRMKRWFIYHDNNLIWSKMATFLVICITCIGTRNKKHLEFNARTQVLLPFVFGIIIIITSVWLFGYEMNMNVKSKFSTNNFKKIRILQFSETRFGSFVGLFSCFYIYKQ